MISLDFVFCQFLAVDGTPGVDDVGQHEGHEQRDIEHSCQCELTAAGVRKRQRRLEIGGRGILGGVVPGTAKQQGQYRQHRTDACRPDATYVVLRQDGLADAEEHEHNTD